jgi:ribulose-5-phosphate 4-epimerase/fuculose-1-phosphate aldolase
MAKPPHVVASHLDVEQDVGPVAGFIQDTNSVIMENHGVTTLGRTISEAYHRLNTLTSEVRRTVLAERLAGRRRDEGPPPGARCCRLDVPARGERHLPLARRDAAAGGR